MSDVRIIITKKSKAEIDSNYDYERMRENISRNLSSYAANHRTNFLSECKTLANDLIINKKTIMSEQLKAWYSTKKHTMFSQLIYIITVGSGSGRKSEVNNEEKKEVLDELINFFETYLTEDEWVGFFTSNDIEYANNFLTNLLLIGSEKSSLIILNKLSQFVTRKKIKEKDLANIFSYGLPTTTTKKTTKNLTNEPANFSSLLVASSVSEAEWKAYWFVLSQLIDKKIIKPVTVKQMLDKTFTPGRTALIASFNCAEVSVLNDILNLLAKLKIYEKVYKQEEFDAFYFTKFQNKHNDYYYLIHYSIIHKKKTILLERMIRELLNLTGKKIRPTENSLKISLDIVRVKNMFIEDFHLEGYKFNVITYAFQELTKLEFIKSIMSAYITLYNHGILEIEDMRSLYTKTNDRNNRNILHLCLYKKSKPDGTDDLLITAYCLENIFVLKHMGILTDKDIANLFLSENEIPEHLDPLTVAFTRNFQTSKLYWNAVIKYFSNYDGMLMLPIYSITDKKDFFELDVVMNNIQLNEYGVRTVKNLFLSNKKLGGCNESIIIFLLKYAKDDHLLFALKKLIWMIKKDFLSPQELNQILSQASLVEYFFKRKPQVRDGFVNDLNTIVKKVVVDTNIDKIDIQDNIKDICKEFIKKLVEPKNPAIEKLVQKYPTGGYYRTPASPTLFMLNSPEYAEKKTTKMNNGSTKRKNDEHQTDHEEEKRADRYNHIDKKLRRK